ncbi:MAG: 1-(5-phosphoribosyl)-5-[(5-phosphoribosylamino)methylideneamino]imidazole-4-carboxamide isomerase [Chloroflexota bacterium]|nr:1-(5-phosphoribosyl)-5-[(5-phosphoribosylamino)methylideneamino]imidazole-4-carboxamide isomerase [Chloroflexota bacterium]
MDIIPAIDIRGGRCVQLVQGDYARETIFGDDPVGMARRWVEQGARRLHVVDLDGAKERRPVNDAIIRRIIDEAGVPVQVSGGMGDIATVRQWASTGASRIVIGTLAIEQPEMIAQAVREHGDKIAIAVDVRGGKAATKGWLETSNATAEEIVREMAALGARHFIYTDISRDGMLQHLDFDAPRRMLALLDEAAPEASLIYSGGVTSLDDVIGLNELPLEGAIIGTALYDGRIDLRTALHALGDARGPR